MTLPTKILFALTLTLIGGAFAQADVTAKEQDAVNFTPAKTVLTNKDENEPLTVRGEIADDQTEGGSCDVSCHPAFTASAKALVKLDLSKIK